MSSSDTWDLEIFERVLAYEGAPGAPRAGLGTVFDRATSDSKGAWTPPRRSPREAFFHILEPAAVEREERELKAALERAPWVPAGIAPPLERGAKTRLSAKLVTAGGMENPAEPKFTIADLYPEIGFGVELGAPGAFKSAAAMTRLKHRQFGLPYAGQATEVGAGMIFAGEAAFMTIIGSKAWDQTFAADLAPKASLSIYETCPILPNEDEDLRAQIYWAEEKPAEIVIDNLFRATAGDPSKVETMQPLIDCCERIRDDFGTLVTLVAHTPSGGDKIFGSIVTLAKCDLLWKYERDKDVLAIYNRRQKSLPEWPHPIEFRRRFVELPGFKRPVFVLEHRTAPAPSMIKPGDREDMGLADRVRRQLETHKAQGSIIGTATAALAKLVARSDLCERLGREPADEEVAVVAKRIRSSLDKAARRVTAERRGETLNKSDQVRPGDRALAQYFLTHSADHDRRWGFQNPAKPELPA